MGAIWVLGVAAAAGLTWASAAGSAAAGTAGEGASASLAQAVIEHSGVAGGVCAWVGDPAPETALALAAARPLVVHCLYADADRCRAVRRSLAASGRYGRVSAAVLEDERLPYAERLVSLLVLDAAGPLGGPEAAVREAWRVLAPLGVVWIGGAAPDRLEAAADRLRQLGATEVGLVRAGGRPWVCGRKPWPDSIDQWTHYLHGPDGNPVAEDWEVAPPERLQWVADPPWLRSHETDSSVSTVVTAQGRLFAIVDEAPISLAGPQSPPDQWRLVARDAFSGVLLWKRPIKQWGWRQWKPTWFTNRPGDFPLDIRKRLAAVGDKLYVTLGYRAPVSQLDARTGELLKTYEATTNASELAVCDGVLVVAVREADGLRVVAVDTTTGRVKWTSERAYGGADADYLKWTSRYAKLKPAIIEPAANLATDGRIVGLLDSPYVVALDFASGRPLWRARFPLDKADAGAGGVRAEGRLWNGTLIVRDGVVLHASPYKLAAFSAEDGRLLWTRPKKYIGHLWYEWKDVFVVDNVVWTWSDELGQGDFVRPDGRRQHEQWPLAVNGYDLQTGRLVRSVPTGPIFKTHHHHRCYRNKATPQFILASRRGTEYVDLTGGSHTVHNWVRGTCHVGMMPANGLQYAPPHPCQCYIQEKLKGFVALAPRAAKENQWPAPDAPGRLTRGPAYGAIAGPSAEPTDWPTFRHDAARSGGASSSVPVDASLRWQAAVGRKVSPPVAAAGRVFVSLVDEHQAACLDGETGRVLWRFTAGGRIDSPPTYYQGAVLFGAADGCVYCLRAADGQLAWRYRAAPAQRLVGAFEQLESAWPVHGSVLVQNGVAYVVAGRSSQVDGGLLLYALDPLTGRLLRARRWSGPDYRVDPSGEKLAVEAAGLGQAEAEGPYETNFRLPEGALSDILAGDGRLVYLGLRALDAQLELAKGVPLLQTKDGFLDDAYFKRMAWTLRGEYARLIVYDQQTAYYVRMFDTLRGLDPTVYFTPGDKGYLLFARSLRGGPPLWSERVRVRVRAMTAAGGALWAAGPPDEVDPADPWGAFEGRKGGVLMAVDAADGRVRASQRLPSPPVFNGVAAAGGRLYLSTESGAVLCFAE